MDRMVTADYDTALPECASSDIAEKNIENATHDDKYIYVTHLGNRSNAVLVKRQRDGVLFVERTSDALHAEIYEQLKAIDSRHLPIIEKIEYVNEECVILEQYIEGDTLDEILKQQGKLPKMAAINYMIQLCDVLKVIHKQKIIHRDIKPENIIITLEDELYLLDFDIARVHQPGQAADTEILGTEGYAAPEQFGFQQSDQRADIFACGVLYNVMLTGMMPVKAREQGIKLDDIDAEIVNKCIEISPVNRYQNASFLKRALQQSRFQEDASYGSKPARMIRKIPGFRTLKIWKMLIAVSVYMFAIIWFIASIIAPEGSEAKTFALIMNLYPVSIYLYIFDISDFRARIKWLKGSRSRLEYVIRHIVVMIILAAIWIGILSVHMVLFGEHFVN